MNTPRSTSSDNRRLAIPAAIAFACLIVYAGTLKTRGFIRDDRAFMMDNALLHGGWRTAPQLLTTGHDQGSMGNASPSHFYRPLLMLTFLLQFETTGSAPGPMHAVNIALQITVCVLLWEALRRRTPEPAAAAAAGIFAVMPIHDEVVSYLTSRSDMLSASLMIGAWLLLENESRGRRFAAGTFLFACALLAKEPSFLFPGMLALADWTFHGRLPWEQGRIKVYAALSLCAAAYLALRRAVLPALFHGGIAYFPGPGKLIAALTYSRFALLHYLLPSLTGGGLCADYSRPLFPDSVPGSPAAWIPLLSLAGLLTLGFGGLTRRRAWAFWVLLPFLFLMPSCHLFAPLDTLGAERYFYFPSVSVAVGLGWLYWRAEMVHRSAARLGLAALLLGYATAATARNSVWLSEEAYYRAAVACNPVSAKSRSALGAVLLERGAVSEGEAAAREAVRLDPRLGAPYYNLAKQAWGRGETDEAEALVRRSLDVDPGPADAWVLLALTQDRKRRPAEEEKALLTAIRIVPWHPLAHYNLARLYLSQNRLGPALSHFRLFLKYAPDDPDAGRIAGLVAELEKTATSRP